MLTLEIHGLKELDAAIQNAVRTATRAVLTAARSEIRRRLTERYLTQGVIHGNPWQPRKSQGRAQRRGRFARTGDAGRPLLVQSGRLRRSWLDASSSEAIDRIIEQDDGILVLEIGTRVPYARAHEEGTRTIPARPLLTPEVLGGNLLPAFPAGPPTGG